MIAYVRGQLILKEENNIIVDNNGIGYNIMVPTSVLEGLPPLGDEVTIYTYMNVREDAMQLFGFLDRDDLDMFKKLIIANGIGPKNALSILSIMTPDELRFAILSDDASKIAKAPGAGVKTASKLILELKDRIELQDAFEKKLAKNTGADEPVRRDIMSVSNDAINETVMALEALGYSRTEAVKAVRNVEITEDMGADKVLKEALKYI